MSSEENCEPMLFTREFTIAAEPAKEENSREKNERGRKRVVAADSIEENPIKRGRPKTCDPQENQQGPVGKTQG